MMRMHGLQTRQNGLVMVEFAIISLLLFVIIFSVMEFSRLIFVWNAVADATRLGARAAAVCSVDSNDNFNITLSDPNGAGNPILPNAITADNIRVRYLDEDGMQVMNPTPDNPASYMQVRFVEVSIINYEHELLIPLFGGTITLPPFTATRPREALGVIPVDGEPNDGNQGC